MARAVNLVCYCTPERRAELTPAEVARFSGIKEADAEALLAQARGDRG